MHSFMMQLHVLSDVETNDQKINIGNRKKGLQNSNDLKKSHFEGLLRKQASAK